MNTPKLICENDFSVAWARAIEILKNNAWNQWNLVVTICNPLLYNNEAIVLMTDFAKENHKVLPSQVQHTIFPQRFYKGDRINNREKFYRWYNRFYARTRSMEHSGWGTYFKRMISYPTKNGEECDQLGNIIDHINNRRSNHGSANIMFIPTIGNETNRTMGGPCLNYVAVQTEKQNGTRVINLLAVYRNHDFYERTFGNYWGLCSLLQYICKETNSNVGSVTCVSSHAYVNACKTELYDIAKTILDRNEHRE